MLKRPSWDDYFLEIAYDVATRGTCLRRVYGAVIVKNKVIISTGYCGSPRGQANCSDIGVCERQRLNIPSGERYELCRSVHAEQNAIINADPDRMLGSTIYIVGIDVNTEELAEAHPCMMCARAIINAQIAEVIYRKADGTIGKKGANTLF
jgi:dCMP deaminase